MHVAEVMMSRSPNRSRPLGAVADGPEFRQLRHHTRNAVQRLIATLHATPEFSTTEHGQRLLEDLERRICLSASISDALFGFREVPGPLPARLQTLARSVVAVHAQPGQEIAVDTSADPDCPANLHETILRVAHEMLANAIIHGFADRARGRIRVRLSLEGNGLRARLQVIDDGTGLREGWERADGREGLGLINEMAAEAGGSVSLRREIDQTVAELVLPTSQRRR